VLNLYNKEYKIDRQKKNKALISYKKMVQKDVMVVVTMYLKTVAVTILLVGVNINSVTCVELNGVPANVLNSVEGNSS
jgi:hypothetical protein